MYGSLERPAGQAEPGDSHSTSGASFGSSAEEAAAARRATAAQQAESKRRRRIYSHCHVQSLLPEGDSARSHGVDKSARRRLIAASVICLIFMIGEVVGGVLSNSLAIATDAAHLLTDFASFMISLFAIWLSSRPASKKMSFGWYRAEVIGALVSVLMIWLVTGLLVYMAVERLRSREFEIDSLVMVITAASGLLVNIIMAIALNVDGHSHGFHGAHSHGHHHNHTHHDHLDEEDEVEEREAEGEHEEEEAAAAAAAAADEQQQVGQSCTQVSGISKGQGHFVVNLGAEQQAKTKNQQVTGAQKRMRNGAGGSGEMGRGRKNINVRAAFVHVIGDFLQSLGVLIAALVIHFEPEYAIVDPICTFLFSIIVLITTINIIRDATNVLMEGIPNGINFIEVREKLQSLPFVIRVHNLRIWSLSLDKIAISSHLVIDSDKMSPSQALKRAIDTLKGSYNFFEVTIQIEEYKDDMKDCEHCQEEEVVIGDTKEEKGSL